MHCSFLFSLQIEKQLDKFSVPKDIQKIVSECLRPRKDEIRLALIEETCNLSETTLKDFDWKLKVSTVCV